MSTPPHAARRAAIVFVLVTLALFALTWIPAVQRTAVAPYARLLARATAVGLRLVSVPAATLGSEVRHRDAQEQRGADRFAIDVRRGCDGVQAMAIYVAAIIAYPTTLGARLLGLAVGLPLLALLNVFRLASLFLVGLRAPELFEDTHVLVWQSLMILFTLLVWAGWERLVVHHQPPPAD